MAIDSIDVTAAIANVEDLLKKEQTVSPALIAAVQMILLLVKLLTDRIGLNSRNSGKPPSSDLNREKSPRNLSKNKPGGQFGHKGSLLQPVSDPDEIKWLAVNSQYLCNDHSYEDAGFEKRQVINIRLSRHVIEFSAQILQNENGQRCIADFPVGVTRPIQYGASVKAHAVYLSLFQLLPYE
jgi:transposase